MRLHHRERFKLIRSPEDDGLLVGLPQIPLDAGSKCLFGVDAQGTKQGPGHFPEEGFDQVQPGAVGRVENEFEPVGYGSQVSPRFSRDMRRTIVKDHTNAGLGLVVSIRQAEKLNELGTAMASRAKSRTSTFRGSMLPTSSEYRAGCTHDRAPPPAADRVRAAGRERRSQSLEYLEWHFE